MRIYFQGTNSFIKSARPIRKKDLHCLNIFFASAWKPQWVNMLNTFFHNEADVPPWRKVQRRRQKPAKKQGRCFGAPWSTLFYSKMVTILPPGFRLNSTLWITRCRSLNLNSGRVCLCRHSHISYLTLEYACCPPTIMYASKDICTWYQGTSTRYQKRSDAYYRYMI